MVKTFLNKKLLCIVATVFLIVIVVSGIFLFVLYDPLNNIENSNETTPDTLGKPELCFKDGQVLSYQDLNISWSKSENAQSYEYSVYLLSGEHSREDSHELENGELLDGGISDNDELLIIIPRQRLKKESWIKISVVACAGEKKESDTRYIYISSTEQIINTQINIMQTTSSPVADGIILFDEYGEKVHSVDYSNLEFVSTYDPDKTMKVDFYMAWDDEYVSMAWNVYSETNWLVEDYDSNGIVNHDDLLNMWRYSCVQFMLCNGAPDTNKTNYQMDGWSGNYLEAGVALMPDGSNGKIVWSSFENQTVDFTETDFIFVGKRNDAEKTTVYEVKIPWSKLGVSDVSEGYKFGFSYAVSAQSDFYKDPHMVEWQDSILGVKNMDAGAVITLVK